MNTDEQDPRHHTQQIEQKLDELAQHLREDLQKFDDPRAKAMFETSAEVLLGLKKAFCDFDSNAESAWSGSGRTITESEIAESYGEIDYMHPDGAPGRTAD